MAEPIVETGSWRHCRWLEPHEAVVKPGSVGPVRAMGGRLGAACETCDEALVPIDPSGCPTCRVATRTSLSRCPDSWHVRSSPEQVSA